MITRPSYADLTGRGAHLGWRLGTRLPERLTATALNAGADAVWARHGPAVLRLEANLARAVPDADTATMRRLSRSAMRSYLRYWGEVFALPRWSQRRVREQVVPHGVDRVRDTLSAGRGVVAALPHMGNWDLAGAWACLEGMPVTTVAERLRPAGRYDDFVRHRRSLGMTVLALSGGPPVVPELERRLREGGFVCLLADRDLTGRGLRVPLLGESARLPPGPAWLAHRTGARLLPVTTSYEGARMHLRVHEQVEVEPGHRGLVAATTALAVAFGVAIRRDPADWHMLQPVFDSDLGRP